MAVRLEDVSKRFDKVQAVCDVTITIADGEFFTLLGPSGCGKTTTSGWWPARVAYLRAGVHRRPRCHEGAPQE